jgi:hypothetical protein
MTEDWEEELQSSEIRSSTLKSMSDFYVCMTEDWDEEIDELEESDDYRMTFASWALQVEFEEYQNSQM